MSTARQNPAPSPYADLIADCIWRTRRRQVPSDMDIVFEFGNLRVYHDGSFSRAPHDLPLRAASPHSVGNAPQVLTRDTTLNASHGTWLRLFLPVNNDGEPERKLPVLLYFHGGGFLAGSTACLPDHNFLSTLALHARVLICSVEYRLAPEHRLPAAYEDGIEALTWLQEQQAIDPWLAIYGDVTKVFVGGDSSGANLAHHVVVAAAAPGFDGQTTALRGFVLINPSFSGQLFTEAEALRPGAVRYTDLKWRLCLPAGCNRDHPFVNPNLSCLAGMPRIPPALVTLASRDFLYGRGLAYYHGLRAAGKQARLFVAEDEDHAFHLNCPHSPNAPLLLKEIAHFMSNTG